MDNGPVKLQQLLAEVEDVLRTMPPRATLRHETDENFAWLGRAAAVIEQWSLPNSVAFIYGLERFQSMDVTAGKQGFAAMIRLLYQAQNDLRMKTTGPLTVAIGHGRVFEYFDELRKIIEQASSDLFFVDAYLDAEFVSRYLTNVRHDVTVRLLMGNDAAKLSRLLPAAALLAQQNGLTINVRSSANLHDRYVFADKISCYHSGASFKDGGKNAGTVISQIIDAFGPMLNTYEALWTAAKVER